MRDSLRTVLLPSMERVVTVGAGRCDKGVCFCMLAPWSCFPLQDESSDKEASGSLRGEDVVWNARTKENWDALSRSTHVGSGPQTLGQEALNASSVPVTNCRKHCVLMSFSSTHRPWMIHISWSESM